MREEEEEKAKINSEEETDKNELFDTVLEDLGGFGRFQIILLILSLIASTIAAFNHVGYVFLVYKPSFDCRSDFNIESHNFTNTESCPSDGSELNCEYDTSNGKRCNNCKDTSNNTNIIIFISFIRIF